MKITFMQGQKTNGIKAFLEVFVNMGEWGSFLMKATNNVFKDHRTLVWSQVPSTHVMHSVQIHESNSQKMGIRLPTKHLN